MKIFDKAILKLTAIFASILLLVSVGFSMVVYKITSNEINREMPQRVGIVVFQGRRVNVEKMITERNAETRQRLLAELIIANILIVSLGVIASYFLARWTLKPVHEAYEAQTRFVSDASHELRTPLAAIMMENEVLLRDKSTTKEELTKQIESNLEEVQKLQRLTSYLLSLSKNDPLLLSELDLKNVITEAVANLTPLAKSKKIEIKTKVSASTIKAEAGALQNIVNILLENAIKYSPASSKIKVAADDNSISISDEGCGISATDLPHIFERFYRSEKSRTSEGYGLGLSLAKSLAEKMDMKIIAENNPDKGAIFKIIH
jgi:signal transduction histidine kinase